MVELPGEIKPLLEKSSVRAMLPRSAPIDFWNIDDGPRILDAFMQLSSEIAIADIDGIEIPNGYRMLATLFDWEGACQNEGWYAFGGLSESRFSALTQAYEAVGLKKEAEALRSAREAWRQEPEDLDGINSAYNGHSHEYSIDLDRLEYLTQYFCDHAGQFLYSGKHNQ